MAYETRLTLNYSFGTLGAAASSSTTTLSSADFAGLPPSLSTAIYVPITLQDSSLKVCEIAWATGHAAGADTVTVVRGREDTAARAWPAGTLWTVAPTTRDGVLVVASRAALPADPHVGMRSYIRDELLIVEWVQGVGWVGTAALSYRTSQLLAADAASVTFANIPTTLKTLQIVWAAKGTQAVTNVDMLLRVNGDATANYYGSYSSQVGTAAPATGVFTALSSAPAGNIPAGTAQATQWGTGELTGEAWNAPAGKPNLGLRYLSHFYDSAANAGYHQGGILYNGVGPYVRLDFFLAAGSVKAGSEFTVYGYA